MAAANPLSGISGMFSGGAKSSSSSSASNALNLAFNPSIVNVTGSPNSNANPTATGNASGSPSSSSSAGISDQNPLSSLLNGVLSSPVGRYDVSQPVASTPTTETADGGSNLGMMALLGIGALMLLGGDSGGHK